MNTAHGNPCSARLLPILHNHLDLRPAPDRLERLPTLCQGVCLGDQLLEVDNAAGQEVYGGWEA